MKQSSNILFFSTMINMSNVTYCLSPIGKRVKLNSRDIINTLNWRSDCAEEMWVSCFLYCIFPCWSVYFFFIEFCLVYKREVMQTLLL